MGQVGGARQGPAVTAPALGDALERPPQHPGIIVLMRTSTLFSEFVAFQREIKRGAKEDFTRGLVGGYRASVTRLYLEGRISFTTAAHLRAASSPAGIHWRMLGALLGLGALRRIEDVARRRSRELEDRIGKMRASRSV